MTATVVPSSWAPLDGAALVAFRLIGAVVGLVEGLWAALLTTVPELKVALKVGAWARDGIGIQVQAGSRPIPNCAASLCPFLAIKQTKTKAAGVGKVSLEKEAPAAAPAEAPEQLPEAEPETQVVASEDAVAEPSPAPAESSPGEYEL